MSPRWSYIVCWFSVIVRELIALLNKTPLAISSFYVWHETFHCILKYFFIQTAVPCSVGAWPQ